MVSRNRRRGRDRAQLVLVGSIAIAFIIIGLVVVFNTVLFTESFAARDSVEEVEGMSEFKQQVTDEVPELIRGVENGTDSNGEFVGDVDENVSVTYSRLLAETYAESGPTYVDVEFDAVESKNGTYVVQDGVRSFTASGGTRNWTVASSHDVTNLTMSVPASSLSNESNRNFTMRLQGDSDQFDVEIWRDSSTLEMQLTHPDGTCSLNGSDDETVEVNVSSGVAIAAGDTCSFDGLNTLSEPYTIEFVNGDQIEGEYDFVAHGQLDLGDYHGREGTSSPYAVYFIREANLELTYETSGVSYEGNRTVTVREEAP